MQIYIDESGSLGNHPGEYFIMAAFIQFDTYTASRCLKRIRTGYLKKKYKEIPELKYNNSSDDMRRRILSCISSVNVQFYYVAYKIPDWYDQSLTDVARDITACLLRGIFQDMAGVSDVYIDRYLHGARQDTFNAALQNVVGRCCINHVDSKNTPGIQIADFIAGTLHRHYNFPNGPGEEQYEIIRLKLTKIE